MRIVAIYFGYYLLCICRNVYKNVYVIYKSQCSGRVSLTAVPLRPPTTLLKATWPLLSGTEFPGKSSALRLSRNGVEAISVQVMIGFSDRESCRNLCSMFHLSDCQPFYRLPRMCSPLSRRLLASLVLFLAALSASESQQCSEFCSRSVRELVSCSVSQ